MKCQALFSLEIKKNSIKMSSTAIVIGTLWGKATTRILDHSDSIKVMMGYQLHTSLEYHPDMT